MYYALFFFSPCHHVAVQWGRLVEPCMVNPRHRPSSVHQDTRVSDCSLKISIESGRLYSDLRATPLLRVKVKIPVKNAVYVCPRPRCIRVYLTMNLTLTRTSGAALRCDLILISARTAGFAFEHSCNVFHPWFLVGNLALYS